MNNELETPAGPIRLAVDGPGSDDALILSQGAGEGMDHPFMTTVARQLAASLAVVRFNFAYIGARKKAPDRQPVLEETFLSVVDQVRAELDPRRLFLGGKSMGGRIASHLVASGTRCDGLLFLGYPLHPPGRPDRLRDAHLYEISAPMLFVEGTRDPFCPLDTLEHVRAKLKAPHELVVVEDGDHSFKVRNSSGRSSDEALIEVTDAIKGWLRRLG